jgi:hypothetical protein
MYRYGRLIGGTYLTELDRGEAERAGAPTPDQRGCS